MVGWTIDKITRYASEFFGSASMSFLEHREKIKKRNININVFSADEAAIKYKEIDHLKLACLPIDDHITRRGLNKLCHALKGKNHIEAQFVIGDNPGLRKREVCLLLLRGVSLYLCQEDPSALVRAATYTLIGCK